jgi:HD superfamily phosphohydrolase
MKKPIDGKSLDSLIQRLNSDSARRTATFVLAGAGAAQAPNLEFELRLPLATALRNQLLQCHYGKQEIAKCLKSFEKETGFKNPSPDQVWQFLIRKPERIQSYASRLHDAFSAAKPIPASYHMLARWFFSADRNVAGIATTNFDLHFGKAFSNVAKALNQQPSIDYDVAEFPQDFRYFTDCDKSKSKIIQRLHGSLDRPWSIVAGAKDNVYDISHILVDHVRSSSAKPFDLIRRVIDIIDPPPTNRKGPSFPPYDFLRDTIRRSSTIVILGYSFQDQELAAALGSADLNSKELFVVDPFPAKDLCAKVPFLKDAQIVKADAETFLEKWIRSDKSPRRLIQLPTAERRLLRDGPKHVPGCAHKRVTSVYEDNVSAIFEDPVYGPFRFSSDIEKEIIRIVDTGEIQRLRQIRQLSFVHLKFHGATHDRFTHSLGVAHLADLLMEYWRGEGLNASPRTLHLGDHRAFVVSALIHDIGHGPFGHTMDLVRRKIRDEGKHEDDTARIFDQIFTNNSFADLDKALNHVDVAKNRIMSILGYGVRAADLDELHYALDNSGCDIDRLDFVLRDAHATLASLDRSERTSDSQRKELLKNLEFLASNYVKLIKSISIRKRNGRSEIFFDVSARPVMQAFASLYVFLYENVYHCWQNVCAQAMLAEAVAEMLRSRKLEFDDIKPLTDVELLAVLEEFENPKVSELAYLVKHRRLFRLLCDSKVPSRKIRVLEKESDKEVVRQITNLKWKEEMIIARLPAKRVTASFVSISELGTGDELLHDDLGAPEILGEIPHRILVFAPHK